MQEVEALLILNNVAGPSKGRALLRAHDSPQSALKTLSWESNPMWKKDLALVHQFSATLLGCTEKNYPLSLRQLPDFPLLLYIMGELRPEDSCALGIVGTRHCSIYGRSIAEEWAESLASSGICVVSGLARGIDTAAHQGALKKGRTLAVIGSGLAQMYPKENINLAAAIGRAGAVISEFPMNTFPAKHQFPLRNRLIPALSKGVLVVEAPSRSGALITARYTLEQQKPLFALPGRVDVESFSGNHLLLKERKALLVQKVQEMISILLPDNDNTHKDKVFFALLDNEEKQLQAHFSSGEITIDELAARTELPVAKVNVVVIKLVLKGLIREFPGKVYKWVKR